MRMYLIPLVVLAATLPLAACSGGKINCPLCYEDEWSREPFPGEPKQHIKALTPQDIKANNGQVPSVAAEFMDTVSATDPQTGLW